MSEGGAQPSAFPSASALAPAPADLGTLRNGLGSLRNLELLLGSVRVGQRALFTAVAAVYDDCEALGASAAGLERSLAEAGVPAASRSGLCSFLRHCLENAERALRRVARRGKLSVSDRLALESVVARAAADLDAALPLAAFAYRAARPPAVEPVPVRLVHDSRVEGRSTPVWLQMPEELDPEGLWMELDAARMLIAIGVALAGRVPSAGRLCVRFERSTAGSATVIEPGPAVGDGVRVAALALVKPTLPCAQAAAQGLGARFEVGPDLARVRIWWPGPPRSLRRAPAS